MKNEQTERYKEILRLHNELVKKVEEAGGTMLLMECVDGWMNFASRGGYNIMANMFLSALHEKEKCALATFAAYQEAVETLLNEKKKQKNENRGKDN